MLTNRDPRGNILRQSGNRPNKYARVVELVDSLDSGSSAHSGRGGSTPPSRTREIDKLRQELVDFLFLNLVHGFVQFMAYFSIRVEGCYILTARKEK